MSVSSQSTKPFSSDSDKSSPDRAPGEWSPRTSSRTSTSISSEGSAGGSPNWSTGTSESSPCRGAQFVTMLVFI